VAHVPPPERVAALMDDAGIGDIRWQRLAGGMATLHVGVVTI